MRQDREPTGLLDRPVETSNTSPNGTGALSVAGTNVITRSVATLKRHTDRTGGPQAQFDHAVRGRTDFLPTSRTQTGISSRGLLAG
ncbi:hypothetical protein GCM10010508_69570 [Streptomyces naganishii JCM 4654]|uniref:Uncharacterized protein n=1 Tax=Streptomyces naganishii JCM 4654 TaxID=1306179 RepID=A0A918YCK2_9ACTN|nr:hypothetical protein GCM10010508_69570 [Streptomyces naganishii JCM 4654]